MFRINNTSFYVMTTRFNYKTYTQNINYRNKNNIKGCIYGVTKPVTDIIPLNAYMFVIEMINMSKIESLYPGYIGGIGLVKNHPYIRGDNIYTDYDYNRYIYKGSEWINRNSINDEGHKSWIRRLEYGLFRGENHQKRSYGITLIPNALLEQPYVKTLLIELLKDNIYKKD